MAAGQPILRSPDVHGDRIVFTCEGDLWLGSLTDGSARRLTRDTGTEEFAKFSPDGSQIAFSAVYDGTQEVYVVPTAGGVPKRVTYKWDYARLIGWAPDGRHLYFKSRSIPRSFGLFKVPVSGGVEEKMPIEFMADADAVNANVVAFTRFVRNDDAWFHYKGGTQNQVWIGDLTAKSFRELTKVPGTNEFPVVQGGRVYFSNENDGSFSLMSISIEGGTPVTHFGPSPLEIRELSAGPGSIMFETGIGISRFNISTNQVEPVAMSLESDFIHMRPFRLKVQDATASGMTIGATGKRALVSVRGQIVSLPVGEGEAKVWKSVSGARLQLAALSPDSKKVAYVSDQTGEMQIWVSDADGNNAKQITSNAKHQLKSLQWSPDSKWITFNDSDMRTMLIGVDGGEAKQIARTPSNWGGPSYDWSPDSKWIAFSTANGITGVSQVSFYEVATGKTTAMGTGFTDDANPAFSQDGKYLAFTSRRSFVAQWDAIINQLNTVEPTVACVVRLRNDLDDPFAPKDTVEGAAAEKKEEATAFRIDFDGLADRMAIVPGRPPSLGQVAWAANRLLMVGGGQVQFYDLAAKRGGLVTNGGSVQVSANGQMIQVGNRVIPANSENAPPTQGVVTAANLTLDIEPEAEWEQIYWDAWRLLRDYFYVENMHGLNWQAIGDKYAKFLPSVRSRDELDILIRWLQAELGSSHQYLSPGPPRETPNTQAAAFLGIDVRNSGGKIQIARILKGDGVLPTERSPLTDPTLGVSEGDYILEIGGQPVDASTNYMDRLVGKVGQPVSLKIAKSASGTGAKTILVRPIANETRMRRVQWVADNRAYVDRISGGKVGYLQLWAMGNEDVQDFVRQFYPQRDKQAMIIDSRFNGGGSTQSPINRILTEHLTGLFNMRGSTHPWSRQGEFFLGPMAVMQNEFNISCGEEFTHRFKDLKRGPIIGRRSYGGEVGSSPGWPLMDGGVISVPNYGMYTPDGKWVIEGPGVEPDIDVPSDPNQFAQGKDPQLDKAVEWLLKEVRDNPVKYPFPPSDPVRIPPGRQGG